MTCSRSVLVVDDDDGIREAIVDSLRDEGYVVETAENGAEALRCLQGRTSEALPCLILLDLMMPVMSGWEFIRARAADTCARIPIVVVSATLDRQIARSSADVVAWVPKPLRYDALLDLVREHCGGDSA